MGGRSFKYHKEIQSLALVWTKPGLERDVNEQYTKGAQHCQQNLDTCLSSHINFTDISLLIHRVSYDTSYISLNSSEQAAHRV